MVDIDEIFSMMQLNVWAWLRNRYPKFYFSYLD